MEAETDEARSKDLKMHVTENNEISSKEKSTTNLDLARDRQIRRKTWKHYNRWNEQGSNLRLDAAPIVLPRQDQALNHWAIRMHKNRCFRNSDFQARLNRLRGWIAKNDQVHILQDLSKLASNGSKKDAIWLKSINEYRNKESSQTTLEAETDEARSKDLKMHVTEKNEISSKEKSTTNLHLARDRQIRRKTWKHYNRWNEQGSNLRLDAAPIALPRQDQALNHWATRILKNRCFRNSDFQARLNRLRGWIAKNDQVHILEDLNKLAINGSKKDAIWLKSINEYRNKESSQTTLEAETDEARSKDLKMHVTENNEISSKEKSTTNLDLARDRQIRRKTWKHYNRWNEQGSNLRPDAAPMALPRQDQALNHWAIRIYKNR